MNGLDVLAMLKEYGLAGVLAWLFWWTLRRMMKSHDDTVSQLKSQLETQCLAARTADESFAKVVENHMTHVVEALGRFEGAQTRLLGVLDKIEARLSRERSAA